MNESLAIGWVYPGDVNGLFMQSIVGLMVDDDMRATPRMLRGAGGTIGVQSGPRIAEARNQVVQHFLTKLDSEWLLMVDTDMVFSPDALDALFDAADPETCPIVGGLCFGGGRSGRMFPTMYLLREAGPGEDPVEIVEDYPENALCQVTATGAAFLLMHRSALQKIGDHYGKPYPWFAEGTVAKGGISFGEDWAFCIRAQSLGIPVHVHTGAKIGHVKPTILNEESYREWKDMRDRIGIDGMVKRHTANFERALPVVIDNYAVIPQKGKTKMTSALLKQLAAEKVLAVVMDNGTDPEELAAMDLHGASVMDCTGDGIYEMWNKGVRFCAKHADGPFNVAVLNNDLRLGPHCMKRLAQALRADDTLVAISPNYDKRPGDGVEKRPRTYAMQGMAGFCFMAKGEEMPEFDENYEWWFGDDDFVNQVWASGKFTGVLRSASVVHLDGGSQTAGDITDPSNPRHATLERDKMRFTEKWSSK